MLASNVKRAEFSTQDNKIKISLLTQTPKLIGGRWRLVNKKMAFDGDGNPWGKAAPAPPGASPAATLGLKLKASASLQSLQALGLEKTAWQARRLVAAPAPLHLEGPGPR